MLINEDSLYLYNLTLKPSSHYIQSIVGQFYPDPPPKQQQQLLLASSTTIELYEINSETGRLEVKSCQNLLGVINKLDIIHRDDHDVLVITSDSGNLTFLEYSTKTKKFSNVLVQEPMTKNGWNRTYPGEYIAIDPENRCVLVSAMEKNKLLYKLEGNMELSSPLDFHSNGLLTLDVIALNTDHENPLFGALELTSGKELVLNYYELDQGLNHIVKRKPTVNEPLPSDANHLIPLPNSINGGMLVCGKNWIFYDNLNSQKRIYLSLPRRKGQDCTIVNHVIHSMKKKKFFILLQNTFGDLFKLSIDYDHDRTLVKDITLTYFDTIPSCISLNIFKSGLLFANVSNNDRILYQFEKLGEEDNELVIKSVDDLATAQKGVFNYKLKSLANLAVIDKLQTLSPLLDSKIINNSKLLTLSSHSYMKTITHGIPTDTLVESPLSINPTDIFTTKLTSSSTNDEYLIISSSLSSKTIVLSLGENVEDVTDSQMLLDQHTIAIQQIGKSSIVQIYTNGIRHIRSDKKTTDWFPPAGITITHASCNNSQVLIALSNFEVVYFEIDPVDDQLVEYQDRLQISGNITAMTIQSDNKSPFGIIGTSDESLSIISLKNNDCLSIKSIQALSSNCVSLKMMKMGKDVAIHIGMTNGVYARLKIDPINGKLSESRSKYLGTKPVLLNSFRLNVNDALQGILAISSKPWIGYLYDDKFKMTPLIMDDTLSNMCSFINEDVGDGQGIVGLSGDNLVIFSIGKEDDTQFDPSQDFIIDKLKLRYTPRKVVEFEDWMFVTECEYNTKGPYKHSINGDIKENVDEEYYEEFGYEKRDKSWGSCIQVLKNDEIIQSIELKNNESIISSTVVTFTKTSPYLIVAIATNQTLLPNGHDKGYLYTYKLGKKNIQFIHKTELDRFPQVLASFQNKLALATANRIQLYDMGQKQLLRKSSTTIPFMVNINKIITQESRIIVSDTHTSSSIAFLKFNDAQNKFIPIADDVTKKQIISMTTLDDDTVIASDKFGNVSISRLDESISRQSEENWTIFSKNLPTSSNSCPYKLTNLCSFYIPDIITGFNVGNLNEIGTSAIVYTGISGLIGLFVPLISKNEIEWLFNLQLLMREKVGCLVGKDHLLFRGYYNPVKNVIDGDLLECYFGLDHGLKTELAQKVNKSIGDIEKKLTDLRNRSAF